MVSKNQNLRDLIIGVVGLGYVGLPLAVEFAQGGIKVIGIDINKKRIKELQRNFDANFEVSKGTLKKIKITFTSEPNNLKKTNFIIAAIPTPITKTNQPDLSLLKAACKMIGENLTKNTIVVFESTVYPGVTEDICRPIIESSSGLKCGPDWKIGYSPERINPGDKVHTLATIVKIISAMDRKTLLKVDQVYSLVCKAGIYRAPNIKTAEAAKVIENIQRDLNISLMNELSLIFNRLGLKTQEVLKASNTKWNFLNFTPGLVGGHCIGVDPYYLVYKAEEIGLHPEVIAAGRRVNDYMGDFVADLTIKSLITAEKNIHGAKVLIFGLTFKENIRDFRNSKILTTIEKLKEYGLKIFGYDPYISQQDMKKNFSIQARKNLVGKYDVAIIATPHEIFSGLEDKILRLLTYKPIIIDIKYFFPHLQNEKEIIYKSL